MRTIENIKLLEGKINSKLKKSSIRIEIVNTKDKLKGKVRIFKGNKVDRILKIQIISGFQINILEKGRIIQNGLYVDNLGAWIFNLYNPIKYCYVFYGGDLNREVLDRRQVDKISNGVKQLESKTEDSILNNQPKVAGYLGPIFEEIDYGKIYLRYETQEIYNMLSA